MAKKKKKNNRENTIGMGVENAYEFWEQRGFCVGLIGPGEPFTPFIDRTTEWVFLFYDENKKIIREEWMDAH